MNSMAQQAVPKGMGQIEDLRPHLLTASTVVVMMFPPPWTLAQVGSTNLPWKRSRSPMGGPFGTGILTHPRCHWRDGPGSFAGPARTARRRRAAPLSRGQSSFSVSAS